MYDPDDIDPEYRERLMALWRTYLPAPAPRPAAEPERLAEPELAVAS